MSKNNLSSLRKINNYSLLKLANNTGISPTTLTNIENSEDEINNSVYKYNIKNTLNIMDDELLYNSIDKNIADVKIYLNTTKYYDDIINTVELTKYKAFAFTEIGKYLFLPSFNDLELKSNLLTDTPDTIEKYVEKSKNIWGISSYERIPDILNFAYSLGFLINYFNSDKDVLSFINSVTVKDKSVEKKFIFLNLNTKRINDIRVLYFEIIKQIGLYFQFHKLDFSLLGDDSSFAERNAIVYALFFLLSRKTIIYFSENNSKNWIDIANKLYITSMLPLNLFTEHLISFNLINEKQSAKFAKLVEKEDMLIWKKELLFSLTVQLFSSGQISYKDLIDNMKKHKIFLNEHYFKLIFDIKDTQDEFQYINTNISEDKPSGKILNIADINKVNEN